jgi:hypothetical protein
VHDNEYVIKPNVIWNMPKEQVADRKEKSNQQNNSFEHKLEKWSRVSCPCQILWVPDTTKDGHLGSQEEIGGGGVIGRLST